MSLKIAISCCSKSYILKTLIPLVILKHITQCSNIKGIYPGGRFYRILSLSANHVYNGIMVLFHVMFVNAGLVLTCDKYFCTQVCKCNIMGRSFGWMLYPSSIWLLGYLICTNFLHQKLVLLIVSSGDASFYSDCAGKFVEVHSWSIVKLSYGVSIYVCVLFCSSNTIHGDSFARYD